LKKGGCGIVVNELSPKIGNLLYFNALPIRPYLDTRLAPHFRPRFSRPKDYFRGSKGKPMFQDPLFLIATVVCLVVLVILMIGIGGFARGGEFNKKYANKLMRYRIIAQALAVLAIVLFTWAKARGGS
jgi:hypothetical protein